MAIKICVYAICKNEMKFIDKWLDSMQTADYIVVLDTGSTDGSFEKLQADPRVTRVEQQIIEPWRFDVARNESMKLVPEDADVLVCTDFDELFTPEWADVIREHWDAQTDRMMYRYAWSHNDIGEPGDTFWYDKIHNRRFKWIYPVHEILTPIIPNTTDYLVKKLDDDRIWLHHYPDESKSRSSYMDLLKLSTEENPKDPHVMMLYAREWIFAGDYTKALDCYKKALAMPQINEEKHKLVLLECTIRCGDMFYNLGNFADAKQYYERFIELDKTYREPYFCLGEMYIKQGLYVLAEAMVRTGLEYGVRKYDWVERKDTWLGLGNYLLSVACFYNGKIDEAIKNSEIALGHDPNNAHMLKNHIAYLQVKIDQIQDAEQVHIRQAIDETTAYYNIDTLEPLGMGGFED